MIGFFDKEKGGGAVVVEEKEIVNGWGLEFEIFLYTLSLIILILLYFILFYPVPCLSCHVVSVLCCAV